MSCDHGLRAEYRVMKTEVRKGAHGWTPEDPSALLLEGAEVARSLHTSYSLQQQSIQHIDSSLTQQQAIQHIDSSLTQLGSKKHNSHLSL